MRRITNTVRNLLIVILCSLSIPLMAARADIAPPEQAPGSNIEPGQPTKVQMAAESVLLDVLSVKGKGKSALPIAAVTANFTMRNAGDADESMMVRFPISDPNGYGDGFGNQPEIDNIVVKVNGKIVPTRIVTTTNPQGADQPPIKWAAFDATFPKGKDTNIEVNYILQSTGYMPYGSFKYILETGAGWDGKIGKADFTVKLPYPATEENVVFNESTPGGQIENGDVKWSFTDLEPTRDSNFKVTVLAPNVWQAIVQAREAVSKNPNDADAWRALARAYRAAIFVKYGPQTGANFVPQIEDAYRQAQKADPTSAQAHSELAQALIDLNEPIFNEFPKELADKVFTELQAALKLDPNNATAVKLAGELQTLLSSLVKAGNPDAQAQLDQLEAIIKETGAQLPKTANEPAVVPTAPAIEAGGTVTPTEVVTPSTPTEVITPTETVTTAVTPTEVVTPSTPSEVITPTETVTPAETAPVVTTETVSATTDGGVVITTTIITSTSRVVTDVVTAQPVTVTEVTKTDVVTSTSDVTGTQPVVVIVIQSNSVATQTAPAEGVPSSVVTSTTSTSASSPVVDGQVQTPTNVVTASIVITASTAIVTDTTTSQPVTVTTVTQSETSTGSSAGMTETAPTQTQIEQTVVTTQTAPNPETGAVVVVTGTTRSIEIAPSVNVTVNVPSQVVTQTEVVTATTEVNPISPTLPATITVVVTKGEVTQRAGEEGQRAPSVVTSTTTTTRTEAPNPIEPTMPATVTVVTTSQAVTATTAITTEAGAEAGAPVVVTTTQTTTSTEAMNPVDAQMPATKTEASTTQVVTATGSVSQPGASTVVTTTTTTTGTMPIPADVTNPPPMEQVEQTEVITTTVDASGQVTTTPPVTSVITRTLPVLPLPTRAPRVQPAPTEPAPTEAATGTVTTTETTTSTVEAGTAAATPEATAEAGATPAANATAPAAQASRSFLGIPSEAWIPLVIVYIIGFILVFALLRRRFNRNKV